MIAARYPSRCAICCQPIEIGHMIERDAEQRWQHSSCLVDLAAYHARLRPAQEAVELERLAARAHEASRLPAPDREALPDTERRFRQLLGERTPDNVGVCERTYAGPAERAYSARCKACGGLAADHLRGVA